MVTETTLAQVLLPRHRLRHTKGDKSAKEPNKEVKARAVFGGYTNLPCQACTEEANKDATETGKMEHMEPTAHQGTDAGSTGGSGSRGKKCAPQACAPKACAAAEERQGKG